VIAKIGEIDISGMLNEARKKLALKSRAHAGQEAAPEDECSCGHPRKDHNEYACRICVVDHTHAFKLAVL
jgi:hypothetical protein